MIKTATICLHGNGYEVDPALVGRRVELVFDPFDLTTTRGPLRRAADGPVPHRITRHSTPTPGPSPPNPPPADGDQLPRRSSPPRTRPARRDASTSTDLATSPRRRAPAPTGTDHDIDAQLDAEPGFLRGPAHTTGRPGHYHPRPDEPLPGQRDLTNLTDDEADHDGQQAPW